MKYFLNLDGDYIASLSTEFGEQEIPESEYNEILSIVRSYPKGAPGGYTYRFNATSLEWELVELPPIPDPDPELTDEEALEILLGGGEA